MIRKILTFLFLIALCNCHQHNTVDSDIILIDANKKYPALDLKLSDIAEISYIPLKTEGVIFGYPGASRRLFVYRDKIFIADRFRSDPKLIVYDHTGNPIQIIGSYGRGPGEYVGLSDFVVDTLTNEVIIYDDHQRKLIVYGIDGKFKREKSLKEINRDQKQLTAIEMINDNFLLAYNGRSITVHNKDFNAGDIPVGKAGQIVPTGKPIMIIDKQTLTETSSLNFEYAKPGLWDVLCIMYYLTTLREGVYITNERSDTIYFMNRNLELIPKFRDVTDYGGLHVARLFPTAETERYVFFTTELGDQQGLIKDFNPIPRKFLVFDKKTQKIFRINNGLSEKREWDDCSIAMLHKQIAFNQYTLTLNHNYASTFFSPEFLHEHYNQLPEELKAITKNLKIDDNPVVMLIKFKGDSGRPDS